MTITRSAATARPALPRPTGNAAVSQASLRFPTIACQTVRPSSSTVATAA
jgi:hypothetical protein